MPALIDRTGEVFGNILILQELGHDRIIGRCLLCGDEREYRKVDVVSGRKKHCPNHRHYFIDTVGKTYGGIVSLKELGDNKILGKCLICGKERTFNKPYLIRTKPESCGCLRRKPSEDCTGKTFNNILVLKELGHGKILGKCLLCGREKEFFRYPVVHGNSKSCGCQRKWDPNRWNSNKTNTKGNSNNG